MVTIKSREDLQSWLADKPADWAQAIAVRAAMRALPHIGRASDNWLVRYGILPIRALSISWAARNFPAHDMRAAAYAAYAASYAPCLAAARRLCRHAYAAAAAAMPPYAACRRRRRRC